MDMRGTPSPVQIGVLDTWNALSPVPVLGHPRELSCAFNTTQLTTKFTTESNNKNFLHFLNAGLLRVGNGGTEVDLIRQFTWVQKYMNFSSFVPVRYLVSSLSNRVKICRQEILSMELE